MVELRDTSVLFGTCLRQDLKQTEIENTFIDTAPTPVVGTMSSKTQVLQELEINSFSTKPWFWRGRIDFWRKSPEDKYFQNIKRKSLTNFQASAPSLSAVFKVDRNNCSELLALHYSYPALETWIGPTILCTAIRFKSGHEKRKFLASIKSPPRLVLPSALNPCIFRNIARLRSCCIHGDLISCNRHDIQDSLPFYVFINWNRATSIVILVLVGSIPPARLVFIDIVF